METEKIMCPKCEKHNINKYGIRNNKQRYRCKDCGCTFYDPNIQEYKYQRNTKRILSLLYNILENDFFGADDLEEALCVKNDYYKIARKIVFDPKYMKEIKNKDCFQIYCYKPKLLICQDDKNITFIPIPSYVPQKDNEYDRYINIIDNKKQSGLYNNIRYKKPLINDKNKKQGNN